MSEQGTGEMGRWGDSELQEMELRLETKLRETVGSGVQWLVRQLDEGMTDIRREMQGMKDVRCRRLQTGCAIRMRRWAGWHYSVQGRRGSLKNS